VAATLDELLTKKTKEQEYRAFLSVLQSRGYPVTDYTPGAASQTLLEAIAFELADFSALLPQVAQGGFVALAKDLADPVWLDLIAEYAYDITRARATFTKQLCRVSCIAGQGPQTVNPGFVVKSSVTGNRYIFQGSPTVVGDGSFADIEFTAENPGASYADGVNTITTIVTPLAGLSVTNRNRSFGGTDSAGAAKKNAGNQGSGTVTPSHAGTPALSRRYTVTVITGGSQPSTGSISIKYEEAGVVTTLATITPIPATSTALGDGITLTFANGAGAGFVAGDVHTFETPGSPITSGGSDDETNEALAARCLGRWPSLSDNPTADKYVAWIIQCSIDNALGLEKVTVKPSTTVAGQSTILVATAAGAPGPGAVTTLQNYINARDGIVDAAEVATAVNEPITLAGTVTVEASKIVAVKAAADAAWIAYIQSLPIGGDVKTGSPGVVRLSELVECIMAAGAVDHSGLTLDGAATNKALTTTQVATVDNLPSGITWVTVAG
jgi:hypothetical protein